jgi:hypothetical protein
MRQDLQVPVQQATQAALDVLLQNARGPFEGLPRTAGSGYPEPYTRDLMVSAFGILASGNEELIDALRRTLEALARNQTKRGHIPSLAHDPKDLGASDTTPLFLIGIALYRRHTGETKFLHKAAEKALTWMDYQSPDDSLMVAQQPTSDWRDEQWVLGYGLYVNTLVYLYLRLFHREKQAEDLRRMMNRFDVLAGPRSSHVHEGLIVPHKPYYALWAYKVLNDERFDLLGNSLAIVSGVAAPCRANNMISWIEAECDSMREKGVLAVDLPPCLFPYMQPGDADWRPRYQYFNMPGDYHNGGVWPFICGFYIAALVATGRFQLAEQKLAALTDLVKPAHEADVQWGFNEWIKAQDGTPRGRDWQTWSAAMYLYAAACVQQRKNPFLEEIRPAPNSDGDGCRGE